MWLLSSTALTRSASSAKDQVRPANANAPSWRDHGGLADPLFASLGGRRVLRDVVARLPLGSHVLEPRTEVVTSRPLDAAAPDARGW